MNDREQYIEPDNSYYKPSRDPGEGRFAYSCFAGSDLYRDGRILQPFVDAYYQLLAHVCEQRQI